MRGDEPLEKTLDCQSTPQVTAVYWQPECPDNTAVMMRWQKTAHHCRPARGQPVLCTLRRQPDRPLGRTTACNSKLPKLEDRAQAGACCRAGSGGGGYRGGLLRLRDWVTSATGESAAAGLISVLIGEHLSASGGRAFPVPI